MQYFYRSPEPRQFIRKIPNRNMSLQTKWQSTVMCLTCERSDDSRDLLSTNCTIVSSECFVMLLLFHSCTEKESACFHIVFGTPQKRVIFFITSCATSYHQLSKFFFFWYTRIKKKVRGFIEPSASRQQLIVTNKENQLLLSLYILQIFDAKVTRS